MEPKNDFERLFKDKFTDMIELKKILDELRALRNKIAYCKIFRKTDCERCNEIIEKIIPKIYEANKLVYET